jgi:ABC-type transporter Mla MlaB component
MSFRIDYLNEQLMLELDGENTVESAAELQQQLLGAGAQTKTVRVAAQDSGAIDITIIQLLAALQNCCPAFHIERPSTEFLASLDRCGIRRHFRSALRQKGRGE